MIEKKSLKIIFAGDRDISVQVLKFIFEQGVKPVALMVSEESKSSHGNELIKLCDYLDSSKIMKGSEFRTKEGIDLIKSLNPDYILGIHFPYIVPKEILSLPKEGVLNLHPAYLPYNRGWHTPSWAILESTPYGGTLHFMDEGVDTGDIVCQRKIKVLPEDTADSLYKRVKLLELEVFKKSWENIVSKNYKRKQQMLKKIKAHKKSDLETIRFIDLKKNIKAGDLIKKIRALTTNDKKEAAYFKTGNKKYLIQIKIIPEK